MSLDYGDPKGNDEIYTYDSKWGMASSPGYDKITSSNTANIGGLFLTYYDDAGIIIPEFHAGLLGKAPQYLPKEAQKYVGGEGLYTFSFDYDLDKDGYVTTTRVTTTLKEDKTNKVVNVPEFSWTESYTYEVIE